MKQHVYIDISMGKPNDYYVCLLSLYRFKYHTNDHIILDYIPFQCQCSDEILSMMGENGGS